MAKHETGEDYLEASLFHQASCLMLQMATAHAHATSDGQHSAAELQLLLYAQQTMANHETGEGWRDYPLSFPASFSPGELLGAANGTRRCSRNTRERQYAEAPRARTTTHGKTTKSMKRLAHLHADASKIIQFRGYNDYDAAAANARALAAAMRASRASAAALRAASRCSAFTAAAAS
jgi:hypothetical protein